MTFASRLEGAADNTRLYNVRSDPSRPDANANTARVDKPTNDALHELILRDKSADASTRHGKQKC